MKTRYKVLLAVVGLALAVVPAYAQVGGNLGTGQDLHRTVSVTAVLGSYVNLDDTSKLSINFGNLPATDIGWKFSQLGVGSSVLTPWASPAVIASPDMAVAKISTNIPLILGWNTGSNLKHASLDSYLSTIFSIFLNGRINRAGGFIGEPVNGSKWIAANYFLRTESGSGSDWSRLTWASPNTSGLNSVSYSNTDAFWVAPAQQAIIMVQAAVKRNGIADLAGTYSQVTPATLTISYNNL